MIIRKAIKDDAYQIADVRSLSDFILEIPQTHHYVFPITSSVVLQLLAYQIANLKGCEIDQPRNLAKSVTVE